MIIENILLDNKDYNELYIVLTSNYTNKQHQGKIYFIDFSFKFKIPNRQKKWKTNGACVFWAPVFFLSFLAGKINFCRQKLLTATIAKDINKNGACVFWAPPVLEKI